MNMPEIDLVFNFNDFENLSNLAIAYNSPIENAPNKYEIGIQLHKINKRCCERTIAEKINNAFLVEFICAIYRANNLEALPPCETHGCYGCALSNIMNKMKLKIH